MTREQWAEQLQMAALKRKRATWEIAWLLVEGQRQAYDANFTESAKLLGYSTSWCYAMYATGRAFPRERAHPDLSFSCHRELLREEDETNRALLFARAIEEKWSQLDAQAWFDKHPPSKRLGPVTVAPPRKLDGRRKTLRPKAPSHYVHVQVRCPACGHVHPVKGNKVRREDDDRNSQEPDSRHEDVRLPDRESEDAAG